MRYRVTVAIVLQLDRWPNEATGANPIIMRWFNGRKLLVCIRIRRPILHCDARVEVTVRGRVRKFQHNDVLWETPGWLSMLKELREVLTTQDA